MAAGARPRPRAARPCVPKNARPPNGAIDPGRDGHGESLPRSTSAPRPRRPSSARCSPPAASTAPSGPQSFGALAAGGGPVCRPFRSGPRAACGATLVGDARAAGRRDRSRHGRVRFHRSAPRSSRSSQNFDGVTAPALPAGWTAANALGVSALEDDDLESRHASQRGVRGRSGLHSRQASDESRLRRPDRLGPRHLPQPHRPGRGFRRRCARSRLRRTSTAEPSRIVTSPAVGGASSPGGYTARARERIRQPDRRPAGLDGHELRLLHDGRGPRAQRRGPHDPAALAHGFRQQRRRRPDGGSTRSRSPTARPAACFPAFVGKPMGVDAHSAAGTSSNVNGVLEPGERVLVAPAWKNTGAGALRADRHRLGVDGSLRDAYTINDSSADYGTVAGRGDQRLLRRHGRLRPDDRLRVPRRARRRTGTRPSRKRFRPAVARTWLLHVGDSFIDVPRSQPFYQKIETLLHSGITSGCNAAAYCPKRQRAAFADGDLPRARASRAAAPPFPREGPSAERRISAGRAASRCSPTSLPRIPSAATFTTSRGKTSRSAARLRSTVRRRASTARRWRPSSPGRSWLPEEGRRFRSPTGRIPATGFSYSCNPASPSIHFTDVPASDSFCKSVALPVGQRRHRRAAAATSYCPGQPVSRDQMAKFLSNAFGLVLYGP